MGIGLWNRRSVTLSIRPCTSMGFRYRRTLSNAFSTFLNTIQHVSEAPNERTVIVISLLFRVELEKRCARLTVLSPRRRQSCQTMKWWNCWKRNLVRFTNPHSTIYLQINCGLLSLPSSIFFLLSFLWLPSVEDTGLRSFLKIPEERIPGTQADGHLILLRHTGSGGRSDDIFPCFET